MSDKIKRVVGRVSLVPKGSYNAAKTYNRLDLVRYGGCSYIVMRDGIRGVTPADGDDYMLMAEKGPTVEVDSTLTKSGEAADAAVVGERLSALSEEIANKLNGGVTASSPEDGEVFIVVDDSGEVVDPDPEDSRTVLHNFDFTQGLTDSVSGVNAVLAGTATQDADGVHFYADNDQLKLMFVVSPSTHIEYDLKSAELTMSSHGRLLTFTTSADAAGSMYGLLWRSGYGWSFYTKSGWGPTINDEEKTCMSGKKLTLSFDVDLVASLYVDGVFWAKAPTTFCTTAAAHYAFIGSSSGGQSAYPMTISAIRVYDGEYGGES